MEANLVISNFSVVSIEASASIPVDVGDLGISEDLRAKYKPSTTPKAISSTNEKPIENRMNRCLLERGLG